MGIKRKGFTLIELLVVIAIIAILSVVVILTLNPAELLRQARDSNRISDMASIKSALGYYLATASKPSITTGTGICFESAPTGYGVSDCTTWFQTALSARTATSTAPDTTGWLPVDFSSLVGGSPLGALPQDPLILTGAPDGVHFYSYIATTTLTFKLDAHMESIQYRNGGGADVESTDGGIDPFSYEQGTNLQL